MLFAFSASAIGVRMHCEIGEQAVVQFMGQARDMLPGIDQFFADEENMRAFYAGCCFPDWGYGGINQDAAEASHWNPFHTAYVEVLRRRFPPPWHAEAQKQVAFFLGVVCHSIADIPWHFSAGVEKSFLQVAIEQGNATHGEAEFSCDLFLFAEDSLKPSLPMAMWWPLDVLDEVFQTAGVAAKPQELSAGTTRVQSYFFAGPVLGLAQNSAQKTKFPWVYAHYKDYYYGGLEHDAAVVSVFNKYYFALLQGWHYYQNTPPYAEYVRRNRDYVPLDAVEETHLMPSRPMNNSGGEPLLEVTGDGPGDARRALLRFNIGDIPGETKLQSAKLWLYFAARRGSSQTAPKTIEAYALNRDWREGDAQTDAVEGVDGRLATADFATWERTGEEGWDIPGGDGIHTDRVSQAAATVTVRPEDASGRWLSWDVTETVRQWVTRPERNHGLLLRETDESLQHPGIVQCIASEAFRCQKDGFGGGQRVAWRPTLIVIPAP
jgi:hypothetical protein